MKRFAFPGMGNIKPLGNIKRVNEKQGFILIGILGVTLFLSFIFYMEFVVQPYQREIYHRKIDALEKMGIIIKTNVKIDLPNIVHISDFNVFLAKIKELNATTVYLQNMEGAQSFDLVNANLTIMWRHNVSSPWETNS